MGDTRRCVGLLWSAMRRDHPRKAAAAIGVDVFVSVAGKPLGALWLKLLIDGAAHGHRATVVFAGLALAGSVALQGALGITSNTLFGDLHESSARVLMADTMGLVAGVPDIEHHERPEYVDRIALLRGDGRLLTNFVSTFGSSVGLVVRIATTVLLLASVHPALLALPLLAVPSVWAGARAGRITEATKEATAERVRRQDHLFALATTPGPAKEARIFNLGDELVDRQGRLWDEVGEESARAQLRAGLVRLAGWLPFAAGYLGAIVLAVSLAARHAASPGDVVLVIALASDVNGQVSRAVSLANSSAGTFRALRRLLWLSDYAAAARAPIANPAAVPERLRTGITFEGVGFRYPGTDVDVLCDVDVVFQAGSVVALVGENGAGKTTLVKLLSRCYEPSAGRITVDGIDLGRMDVAAWRQRLSAGFQDYVRFQLLLREAVGVGDLHRIDDEAALAWGQATDLAAGLPRGLDSQLGKQFEGGTELSEGQWQKVAIARAMMAEGPLLLVLDEPTSGLDATAEHELFERYAEAATGAAAAVGAVTVLVSHRFSTVRLADKIVVIDGGRVVEHGSHDELMNRGGLYAELYGMQAKAYR